jgi:glycogen debranching enzyme
MTATATATEIPGDRREWLEADGLGGFACGPVSGPRTRRYHALLVTGGASRFVLVNGIDVQLDTPEGTWPLSIHRYVGGTAPAEGLRATVTFVGEPWPTWRYRLPDGTLLEHTVFMRHGRSQTFLSWRMLEGGPAMLRVRPLLSGRDYHALHHENAVFRFEPRHEEERLIFRPYDAVPTIVLGGSGVYRHDPVWYRGFQYDEEAARGLDCVEDLASPGELHFNLAAEASLILGAAAGEPLAYGRGFESERRRGFRSPLHRAADTYVVKRRRGKTIIAGYPWFSDWGRDTFIAMRGLCLATGRVDDARAIIARWCGVISEGMLPGRFPDGDGPPEYHSVDAALWFVVAVNDYLQAVSPEPLDRFRFTGAVESILAAYAAGTRYGIRCTEDGLLAAGDGGTPLTWMDARVDGRPVTPRTGKPVEVQALWLNALWIGARLQLPSSARWLELHVRGRASFEARFWNPRTESLHDVVDVDHVPGTADESLRPNQILAVGGLPLPLLEGARARAVVDAVETRLLTPLGLRTLAPDDAGYCPQYQGGVLERDGAYHQGTVWPWLMGPFVEAWVRVNGGTEAARQEAQERFVQPLLARVGELGVGHLPELAGAEPPHRLTGCPFQAWSLGELLRVLARR